MPPGVGDKKEREGAFFFVLSRCGGIIKRLSGLCEVCTGRMEKNGTIHGTTLGSPEQFVPRLLLFQITKKTTKERLPSMI